MLKLKNKTKKHVSKKILVVQIFSDSSRLYPPQPFSQTQHNVLLSPLKACIVTAVIAASKINTTSLFHADQKNHPVHTNTHTRTQPSHTPHPNLAAN